MLNVEELAKPLNAAYVAKHPYTGMDYIQAHHAIREANRIFGFEGWSRSTEMLQMVQQEQKTNAKGKELWFVGYICQVRVIAGDVVRNGTGFGQGQDADLGSAHESAVKEAESDAMKRALMTFGDQFGLALYDKAKAHVEVVPDPPKVKATPEEYIANTYYGGSLEDVTEWMGNVHTDSKTLRAFASWHFKTRPKGTDLGAHFQQFKAEQEAKV